MAASYHPSLLDLPLELQYEVFSYTVPHEIEYRSPRPGECEGSMKWFLPRNASILRVNRELSANALSYMYSTTFSFWVDAGDKFFLARGSDENGNRKERMYDLPCKEIGSNFFKRIRKCRLTIDPLDYLFNHTQLEAGTTGAGVAEFADLICQAEDLRHLHIVFDQGFKSEFHNGCHSQDDLEVVLEGLRKIKGVAEVKIERVGDEQFLADLEHDMMSK
ncbi:MAG: hypothetical protein M1820_006200 [Bogoriella megaspora]|nr:MAG: hypothetical protein M1820_006200 [Bogoriella megaspora]